MLDSYGRNIDYIRISVTDRCNFQCLYCSHRLDVLPRERVLRFEDIMNIAKAAKDLGFKKVRLTGGEPLLRRHIEQLVAMLEPLGLSIHMTTNGYFLRNLSKPLFDAGLNGVNVSLDFVDAEKFRNITNGGRVEDVIAGIDSALDAGLKVKLNTVFTSWHTTDDMKQLIMFSKSRSIPIRFIELMPKNESSFSALFRNISEAKEMMGAFTEMTVDQVSDSDGPAQYFVTEDGVKVGFISFFNLNQCKQCNRLRVSSNGTIYPCLLSNKKLDAFDDIKAGKTKEILSEAILMKPIHGNANEVGPYMSEIGG